MRRLSARLRSDESGVSAVEFAICLPFLVLLYLGGYQLSDAISAYRKVTTATRSVADLTSQYTTVTPTDLDTILTASTQVLAPYKIDSAKLTVTQVYTNAGGVSTVAWSRGKNVSALTKGDPFTLPAAIKQNSSYLIISSIDYSYVPVAGGSYVATIPMRDQIIMGPRASIQVSCPTC